ncbi:MAG: hypothetical protein AAGK92_00290 [Pseudomonadota bacterium]
MQKRAQRPIPSSIAKIDTQRHSPAANDNHPFRLMALADVHVQVGVMEREQLQSVDDLIEGDTWSFKGCRNMVSADIQDEGCCTSINFASGIDVGMASFVIGTAVNLTLMSSGGTMLFCRHITNRDSDGQSYVILPAGFDPSQTYQLIAKSGGAC